MNASSDSCQIGWNIANKVFCDHPDFREVTGSWAAAPLQIKVALHQTGGGYRWVKAQWNALHSILDCSLLDVGLVAVDFFFFFGCLPNRLWDFSAGYSCGYSGRIQHFLVYHFTDSVCMLNFNWLHNIPLYQCAMISLAPPKFIII